MKTSEQRRRTRRVGKYFMDAMNDWEIGRFGNLLNPTRRGVSHIPFPDYLKFPAVNNTLLSYFSDCPLSAYEFLAGLTNDKPTAPMILGSAVDCLLCNRELMEELFYIRPMEIEGLPWHGNRTACKEWLGKHSDRPVLTGDTIAEAEAIASCVLEDSKAAKLIEQCETQLSVFWTDKKTGLQMKGRMDFKAPRFAADLKVVSDAKSEKLAKAIESNRWHVQGAIYSDGLESIGEECNTFYIIAAQSGERPKVNVRAYKCDAIELGRAQYQKELRELKTCIQTGTWPSYGGAGDEIQEIDLPKYAYAQEEVALVVGGKAVGY